MHILKRLRYPKLLLLLLTFVLAYFIFSEARELPFYGVWGSWGYIGTFIAGTFFTYGFTSAPAAAVLMVLGKGQNIFLGAALGGLGALIGDAIIFKLVRTTFADEIRRLSRARMVLRAEERLPHLLKKHLAPVLAGFIIASPLPDEIGVSLLAASHKISAKKFALLSFSFNSLGILALLVIGSAI